MNYFRCLSRIKKALGDFTFEEVLLSLLKWKQLDLSRKHMSKRDFGGGVPVSVWRDAEGSQVFPFVYVVDLCNCIWSRWHCWSSHQWQWIRLWNALTHQLWRQRSHPRAPHAYLEKHTILYQQLQFSDMKRQKSEDRVKLEALHMSWFHDKMKSPTNICVY